jgi:hypothetical protein
VLYPEYYSKLPGAASVCVVCGTDRFLAGISW